MVGPKDGHPVPRTGISANITTPIGTNKFYAGLFLADQTDSVWTHPYSIRWAKGVDNIKSWGMAITHIERSQVTYGPGNPAQYYVNPIGIDSLVFSAAEFGSSTVLTTDNHEAFSVNAHLAPSAGAAPLLTMPLVQGMGFVTAIYSSGTPLIQSGVFFKALSPLSVNNGISKTTATLQDGTQWVIYVIPSNAKSSPNIILNDSQTVQISSGFSGIIQIAKLAGGDSAAGVYDSSAGAYAVAGAVSGTIVSQFTVSTTGTTTASYSLFWTKQGDTSKTLIMFALPHHVQSFDGTTGALKTNITLQTTTKGIATGLLADSWTMIEQLASNMTFAPYSPTSGSATSLPAAAVSLIAQTAAEELGEDISAQTNLDTMYFSGKALAKFAAIIYTAHDLANSAGIAAAGLVKLEAAFDVFVQNHQKNRLVYDTTWKGVVSSAGWKDIGADYGGKSLRHSTKTHN
jgi:endo-1,3(4)-beta-glucanase